MRFILMFLLLTGTIRAEKMKVEYLPAPAALRDAKKVTIVNKSNYAYLGDKAYTALKKWGRYEVVEEKDADLMFVLSAEECQTGTQTIANATSFGGNGVWGKSASANATEYNLTAMFTHLTILDKTGAVIFRNVKPWGDKKKGGATFLLIEDLKQRLK